MKNTSPRAARWIVNVFCALVSVGTVAAPAESFEEKTPGWHFQGRMESAPENARAGGLDNALLVIGDSPPEDQHSGSPQAATALRQSDSVEEKIRCYVQEMTIEEKLLQMNLRPPPDRMVPGLGSYSQVGIARLGLGGIRGSDGPRGPRPNGQLPAGRPEDGHNGPVSPTSLCLASNWDPAAQEEAGRQWGLLCKEYGLNMLCAPGINMIKDNRAGRNAEYSSEDPFLAGKTGAAIVRGLQSVGTAACVKHFVANNWETGRQNHDVRVPERSLRELYLPAFRLALEEGGAWSMMTCYNQVNGEWGSANKGLLADIVRGEWGFKGCYISDWGAKFGSAAQAVKAGQDIEMPGQKQFNLQAIQAALAAGEITMADIDARVAEVLRVKLADLTYFGDATPSGYRLEDFQEMMRRSGTGGLVLLKNAGGVLPLARAQKIALIGPFAADKELTVGNQGSSTVYPSYAVTLKEALEAQHVQVSYTQGCPSVMYAGAAFRDLPCRIDYFNGDDLAGAPVHSEQLDALNVSAFLPAGADGMSVNDGVTGKAFHTAGHAPTRLARTPDAREWTVAAWVRLEDQIPAVGNTLFSLRNEEGQSIEVQAGKLITKSKDRPGRSEKTTWQDMNRRWLPVAMVSDGQSVSLYRDGELIARAADTGAFAPLEVSVGARSGLALDLDDLMIWNQALTGPQVQALARKQLAGLPAPVETNTFETPQFAGGGIPGIKDAMSLSARATGRLQLAHPGKTAFRVECNGGVRIKIDGKLVYDLWDEELGEGCQQTFWPVFNDTAPHEIVVEYANKNRKDAGYLRVDYAAPPARDLFAEARAAAAASDVAVVCVGVDPGRMQGENRDRPTYAMPSWQDELVRAVRAANPKTVVVLFTAGGCDLSAWIDQVPAVVEAFHPGSEGGNIVSSVLFGDSNPSGKLTVSWPLRQEDLPYTGPDSQYRDTVCEFGYRYFDQQKKPVRFPFGYGLSYTAFDYQNLTVKKSDDPKYPVSATVTLKNIGSRTGKEVAQVYASDPAGNVGEPLKKLAGYAKVELAPGETRTVEIPLYWMAFQYYDASGKAWKQEPGDFVILAGPSSGNLPLKASAHL